MMLIKPGLDFYLLLFHLKMVTHHIFLTVFPHELHLFRAFAFLTLFKLSKFCLK